MMMTNEAPFNLNEINVAWCELLSRYVVAKLSLEKEIALLRADNERLAMSNEDLQARLQQAEINLIATKGKQIIDGE